MKKTIMEWLGEKKLYEKKLEKIEKQLNKSSFFVVEPKLYIDEKASRELLEETKSLYDSYLATYNNLSKINQALMKFNALTEITVAGKVITIAYALSKKTSKSLADKLNYVLSNAINDKKAFITIIKDKQEKEVKNLEVQLNNSTKAMSKDTIKERLLERQDDYTPIVLEAFDFTSEYQRITEEEEKYLQEVNTQINIANVKNELEINLD